MGGAPKRSHKQSVKKLGEVAIDIREQSNAEMHRKLEEIYAEGLDLNERHECFEPRCFFIMGLTVLLVLVFSIFVYNIERVEHNINEFCPIYREPLNIVPAENPQVNVDQRLHFSS